MNKSVTRDIYGTLIEPTTLKIQRLLPGPVERIWAYLVESDKRRKWLAAGTMEMKLGAPFEFVWRNDELTDPPGKRIEGCSEEHRMLSRITELDPPRKIAFTFDSGEVSIELEAQGEEVLLTLIHRRLPNRNYMLGVSAGWHAHLDVLVARLRGQEPSEPFWDHMSALRTEYDRRLPA
jgi:uncharacterized protein YndB with AHSA1/START domain